MTLSKNAKIYIAGHRGLVGSAIWNNLQSRGYHNLVGRTHSELDLTDQQAVKAFFDQERPDAVVLAAAFVGGIMANSLYRADFIMQNMKMQCNVIENAYTHGVKKLLFLGTGTALALAAVLYGGMAWLGSARALGAVGALLDALGCAVPILVSGFFILYLYNGQRAAQHRGFYKWFFYAFYPGHLLVLGLLRLALMG